MNMRWISAIDHIWIRTNDFFLSSRNRQWNDRSDGNCNLSSGQFCEFQFNAINRALDHSIFLYLESVHSFSMLFPGVSRKNMRNNIESQARRRVYCFIQMLRMQNKRKHSADGCNKAPMFDGHFTKWISSVYLYKILGRDAARHVNGFPAIHVDFISFVSLSAKWVWSLVHCDMNNDRKICIVIDKSVALVLWILLPLFLGWFHWKTSIHHLVWQCRRV